MCVEISSVVIVTAKIGYFKIFMFCENISISATVEIAIVFVYNFSWPNQIIFHTMQCTTVHMLFEKPPQF